MITAMGSHTLCHLKKVIVEQFPSSLMSTMWRNTVSTARNGSRFEHHIRLLNAEYWHVWAECHKNLGLVCADRTHNPSPYRLRVRDHFVGHALVHWNQNFSRPVLTHLLTHLLHNSDHITQSLSHTEISTGIKYVKTTQASLLANVIYPRFGLWYVLEEDISCGCWCIYTELCHR